MRTVSAIVGAMGEIRAYFQLVTAPPLLQRKPVNRQEFKLIGVPCPGVEEIAAPPVGRNQHVAWPLAVRVAVKSGVAKYRAQQRAGVELVAVIGPDGYSALPIIRGRGLGHEGINVCEL